MNNFRGFLSKSHEGNISLEMCSNEFFCKHALSRVYCKFRIAQREGWISENRMEYRTEIEERLDSISSSDSQHGPLFEEVDYAFGEDDDDDDYEEEDEEEEDDYDDYYNDDDDDEDDVFWKHTRQESLADQTDNDIHRLDEVCIVVTVTITHLFSATTC